MVASWPPLSGAGIYHNGKTASAPQSHNSVHSSRCRVARHTSWREEPKPAYTMQGAKAPYRPHTYKRCLDTPSVSERSQRDTQAG